MSDNNKTYSSTLLPLFTVIDHSGSMGMATDDGKTRMDHLNEFVQMVTQICVEHPTLADQIRLSVRAFDDDAQVVTGLSSADDFQYTPNLSIGGCTNYTAAFTKAKDEIQKAVPSLKTADDIGIYRPTVFFFTDGEPTDSEISRRQAWDALTDPSFKYHPNVFTFGVGEADREAIKHYKSGHGMVFIQKKDSNIADAIKEILVMLVNSIVSSGLNPNQNTGGQIVIDPDALKDLEDIELID
jgi:uncharacterized protein YegL